MKSAVILIPSYEPDELLIQTVSELVENEFPILVVNDGSGNEFEPIFDKVKPMVKYLAFEKNKGKGAAMKYGYSKIEELFPEAKYIITVDGDGQHSLKDILRVYEKLEKTDQLVFGVREFGKDVPFRSRFGNDFSKTTRSLLTKTYIQDDQCGLRGFPKRYLPTLQKIIGNRYEYEMNQMVEFQMMQVPMYTIPIETIYLDSNSRSHFSPFKDTFRIQTIIFSHSIISLLSLCALIAMLCIGFWHNVMPTIGVVYLSYTVAFLFFFLLLNIFYPTQRFFRRLFKELLFTAIKMQSFHLLAMLTIDVLHWNAFVIVPLGVIACSFLNLVFSWLFRKMFPSF